MGCVPGGIDVSMVSTCAGMLLPRSASSADRESTCSLLGICIQHASTHLSTLLSQGTGSGVDGATQAAKMKAVWRALALQAAEPVLDACCSCKSSSSPELLIGSLQLPKTPTRDFCQDGGMSECKRGSAHISCEEEPKQAFWQRLAARFCARKHLLQLWNAVPPESDALFRVQQRGLPEQALH